MLVPAGFAEDDEPLALCGDFFPRIGVFRDVAFEALQSFAIDVKFADEFGEREEEGGRREGSTLLPLPSSLLPTGEELHRVEAFPTRCEQLIQLKRNRAPRHQRRLIKLRALAQF